MTRNRTSVHVDHDFPKKPSYTIRELVEFGIASKSHMYAEHRGGRLILRKRGRSTLVLHDDLMCWLRSSPIKAPLSEAHRVRALKRWSNARRETDARSQATDALAVS